MSRGRRMLVGAALALAIALPLSLLRTTCLVVPTSDGLWRGIADPPSGWHMATAAAVGGLVAALLVRSPPLSWSPLCVGLLAVAPLVPVLTGRGLCLLLFTAPVMRILLFAALAASLARTLRPWAKEPRIPGLAVPIAAFAFSCAFGLYWPGPAGTQGDEPHYLTMTESLLRDGDLDLRNQYQTGAYRSFYSGVLTPQTWMRSPSGRAYPPHAPGLPALLLPAYALAGVAGARLFMSLAAALTTWLVFRLVRDSTGHTGAALFAACAFALTPPQAYYARALYPEPLAALVTAIVLVAGRPGAPTGWRVAAAAGAAFVPWLHPKFLLLGAVGLVVALRGVSRRVAIPLGVATAASACAFLAASHYSLGPLGPDAAAGLGSTLALRHAWPGAVGLFLDRQCGLLVVGWVWVLAFPGALVLARRAPGDALRALLAAGSVFVVSAGVPYWWGGLASPPARFLVPTLPAMALAVGHVAARRKTLAAALAGGGLGITTVVADAPRALHNQMDGRSALLEVLAPGLNLDRFLPSLISREPDAWILCLGLLAAFALLWRWRGPGLLAALVGYGLLVAALRPGPLIDAPRATLALLQGYDDRAVVALQGPPRAEGLTVPLDLPGAPWDLTPLQVRRSRPIRLPPGAYRLEVSGQVLSGFGLGGSARLEVLGARAAVDDTEPNPAIALDLPRGTRRLVVEARGLRGRVRVTRVIVRPVRLLTRRERASAAAP